MLSQKSPCFTAKQKRLLVKNNDNEKNFLILEKVLIAKNEIIGNALIKLNKAIRNN